MLKACDQLEVVAPAPIKIWFTDESGNVITEIEEDVPFYIKGKLHREQKSNIPIYLFYCEGANPSLMDYLGLMDRTTIDGSFSFYMSSGGWGWRQCFKVMACIW